LRRIVVTGIPEVLMVSRLLFSILLLAALPVGAQSLFVPEGHTAPYLGAGWFTDGELHGAMAEVGVMLQGKADAGLQVTREDLGNGRHATLWSPGVRLHVSRPRPESLVGFSVEASLTMGRIGYDDEPGNHAVVKGAGAAARLAVVPRSWLGDGYVYLALGAQTITVGSATGDAYPVAFGVARRIARELLADARFTSADGEHRYLLGALLVF